MKRMWMGVFVVVVVLATFGLNKPALAEDQPDFRKVRWGMTREQVMAAETAPFNQEYPDHLVYDEKVNGLKCCLIYVFRKNVLVEASYLVEERFVSDNRYLEEYDALKRLLVKKYGAPLADEVKWKDDHYKNNPYMWGFAVGDGDLVMSAMWETERTKLSLVLEGKDFEESLMIVYAAKGFEDLIDDTEEELSDL